MNDKTAGNTLSWEVNVSLLDNPVVLKAFGIWIGLTYVVVMALMSFIAAVQGRWDMIPKFAVLFAVVCAGLLVLCAAIMAVLFRNRMAMRFALDDDGVASAVVDRLAAGAGLVAAGVGAATANPTLAGAGLIASGNSATFTAWPAIRSASYRPRRRTIVFRNGWRDVGWLVCTPDNFEAVAGRVGAILSRPDREVAPARRGLMAGYILHTILVVAAATPSFILPFPFEIDLFAPLLLLCFALATLWLVPLLGWVNLAAIGWLAVQVTWNYSDFGLGRLDDGERLLLAATVVGLLYLAWFSIQMLRGRLQSALMALTDEQQGG